MPEDPDGSAGPPMPEAAEEISKSDRAPRTAPEVTPEKGRMTDGRSITYYWLKGTDRHG